MTATADSILKADRRGRLRYSPEQRSALVDAYQSSGLSGSCFAEVHGVAYQTLAAWVAKRRRSASPGLPAPPPAALLSLVAVDLEAQPPVTAPMELSLPGGARLLITAPGQVPLAAALIRELAQARPC
jgi:transposase-like protein